MSHSKQLRTGSKSREGKANRTSNEPNDDSQDPFYEKITSMQLQPLKSFDVPALTNLIERFRKQIQGPIQLHTSIFNSKALQRCLEHNNVSTLFCISDKKPLCVTCMYQNNLHKKHKVVPLNRASRELEDQKNRNFNLIENEIIRLDKLITRSHSNLSRAQKQFPEVVNNLNDFYKELQSLLLQKRNEQMLHVQKIWQKMRYEYSSLATELSNIKIYVLEQVRQIKKRSSQEFLLYNRNICSNLVKVEEILHSDMCQYHETTYNQQLKKFRTFEHEIDRHLILTSPFHEKVRRDPKKSVGSNLNENTRKILKNVENMNQAVELIDLYRENDNRSSMDRKNSKNKQMMSSGIWNQNNKRRSLSPTPFKPKPAVSAHKPPNVTHTPIKG